MKCNVCGENYNSPSLGGAGICGRCDCGIAPDGHKLSFEEAMGISNRYRTGQIPYYKPEVTGQPVADLLQGDDSERLPLA